MVRVTVADATVALQELVTDAAKKAAGSNTLLSQAEQKTLDPFLGRAADRVRAAGGKGARVSVASLTSQAVTDAAQAWSLQNKPGSGQKFLSQKEIQAVAAQDPALGALSKMAYLRVSQGTGGGDIKAAVTSFFDHYNFANTDPDVGGHPLAQGLPGATRIDARPIFPQNRASVPAGVLASYDFYNRAMENDWATVILQKAKIDGHDVFINYMTTDGDAQYLEIFDKKGAPVASARLNADTLLGWDEVFGRTRFQEAMVWLDEFATQEGLSQPADAIAAGQVSPDWTGDLSLSQGRLHYNEFYRLGRIDLPAAEGSPRHELALASFEYLWDRSLRARVQGGSEPFLLGSMREGTMELGAFTRPTDGKVFEVAKWKDIDDGSFTLYFDRTAEGRLKLAIEQFDN